MPARAKGKKANAAPQISPEVLGVFKDLAKAGVVQQHDLRRIVDTLNGTFHDEGRGFCSPDDTRRIFRTVDPDNSGVLMPDGSWGAPATGVLTCEQFSVVCGMLAKQYNGMSEPALIAGVQQVMQLQAEQRKQRQMFQQSTGDEERGHFKPSQAVYRDPKRRLDTETASPEERRRQYQAKDHDGTAGARTVQLPTAAPRRAGAGQTPAEPPAKTPDARVPDMKTPDASPAPGPGPRRKRAPPPWLEQEQPATPKPQKPARGKVPPPWKKEEPIVLKEPVAEAKEEPGSPAKAAAAGAGRRARELWMREEESSGARKPRPKHPAVTPQSVLAGGSAADVPELPAERAESHMSSITSRIQNRAPSVASTRRVVASPGVRSPAPAPEDDHWYRQGRESPASALHPRRQPQSAFDGQTPASVKQKRAAKQVPNLEISVVRVDTKTTLAEQQPAAQTDTPQQPVRLRPPASPAPRTPAIGVQPRSPAVPPPQSPAVGASYPWEGEKFPEPTQTAPASATRATPGWEKFSGGTPQTQQQQPWANFEKFTDDSPGQKLQFSWRREAGTGPHWEKLGDDTAGPVASSHRCERCDGLAKEVAELTARLSEAERLAATSKQRFAADAAKREKALKAARSEAHDRDDEIQNLQQANRAMDRKVQSLLGELSTLRAQGSRGAAVGTPDVSSESGQVTLLKEQLQQVEAELQAAVQEKDHFQREARTAAERAQQWQTDGATHKDASTATSEGAIADAVGAMSQQVWVLSRALELRSREADRQRDMLMALRGKLSGTPGMAAVLGGLSDMLRDSQKVGAADEEEFFGSDGATMAIARTAAVAARAVVALQKQLRAPDQRRASDPRRPSAQGGSTPEQSTPRHADSPDLLGQTLARVVQEVDSAIAGVVSPAETELLSAAAADAAGSSPAPQNTVRYLYRNHPAPGIDGAVPVAELRRARERETELLDVLAERDRTVALLDDRLRQAQKAIVSSAGVGMENEVKLVHAKKSLQRIMDSIPVHMRQAIAVPAVPHLRDEDIPSSAAPTQPHPALPAHADAAAVRQARTPPLQAASPSPAGRVAQSPSPCQAAAGDGVTLHPRVARALVLASLGEEGTTRAAAVAADRRMRISEASRLLTPGGQEGGAAR
eukprot:TRINITY_DN19108_c0_g1_i2.p1 TRINITY_DN19108_c0_g1~~TRINITY_DN19108_c0_g1_i2.p1  ORF type:complete len:1152 (+),score=428.65 TRINITY_DN19108_c0_g1_i2:59-3457(+)